jgi:hypothetical protein
MSTFFLMDCYLSFLFFFFWYTGHMNAEGIYHYTVGNNDVDYVHKNKALLTRETLSNMIAPTSMNGCGCPC